MNFFDLIDPSFSYRLVTALMHFLWQGCLVALLAVIGNWLLSGTSASRRYALHVAALAVMVACVPITFSFIESPVVAPALAVESISTATISEPDDFAPEKVDRDLIQPTAPIEFAEIAPPLSDVPTTVDEVEAPEPLVVHAERSSQADANPSQELSRWAPQIAALYFVCCALLLCRLIHGAWGAHRLWRSATIVSEDSLLGILQRQSKMLGLRALPRIAWCANVSIPLVIGVLKPMILLPAAAATGFSQEQLQALITHELAHIHRHDLVVNLVQRVVESMLFFHPAVWYISRRISNEREFACDELVLATGCERVRYADALVRMAELSSSLRSSGTSASATSLAAAGDNSSEFKRRVLKVLSVPATSQVRPGRIALLAIAALIIVAAASASRLHLNVFAATPPSTASDSPSTGRSSPDPALDPTAGLPNSDEETNQPNNANGDLRSKPAAGSGDTRRVPKAAASKRSDPPGDRAVEKTQKRVAIQDVVRGVDFLRVKVVGFEEALLRTPELHVPDPKNPGTWVRPKNVFPMPLGEHTWLKYPAGSGHFYIEHRPDGSPAGELLYGPIEGDPFEVLKLDDFFREKLKPDSKIVGSDPRYRLRLMFRTAEPSLMQRAWQFIEPVLSRKFSNRNEPGFFERLEILEIARDGLREQVAANKSAELVDLGQRMRDVIGAAEASVDAINDSVPDASYQSATYLQPKIQAQLPAALWGKPVSGLRLGLVPRESGPDSEWNALPADASLPTTIKAKPGEPLHYLLMVENVSDAEIKFCGYVGGEEMARSVEILDHKGQPAWIDSLHTDIPHFISHWRLKPRERMLLTIPAIHFRPVSPDSPTKGLGYHVTAANGRYSLRCSYHFGDLDTSRQRHIPGKTEWIGPLTTGTQTITVGAGKDDDATANAAATAPPDGLEFLKPYPKLHGLSLDMTEPQFLEIVKQQELKTRKTVEGDKVTHHIGLGDGHTLIVMFDKDAKCSGIQRVRGEDNSVRPPALRVLRKPALLLPDHWIVQAVGFDNDGKELVTASNQNFITIRRWDVVGMKLISEIKLQGDKHGRAVRDGTLKFSGDRRRVIAATDEYVGIWDATTGKLHKQLPFKTKEGIYSCAIDMLDGTPDLSVIVGHRALPGRMTLSYDAHVIVWNGLSGNVLQTVIDKGATDLKAIDLSMDGKRLVTTNGGGANIWETSTGQLLRSIPNDNTGSSHVRQNVGNAATPPRSGERGYGSETSSSQYTSHVWSVQFSPDGKQLAMGDILGVKLLDATSGKLLQQLEGPYRYSSGSPGLVFSRDGQWLARLGTRGEPGEGKADYIVPIWSTRTGARLFELHTEANDAAFSDDGQRLAVVFSDMQQALSVWDLSEARSHARQSVGNSVPNAADPPSGDGGYVRQNVAGPGPHSRQDRVEENGHYVGKTAAEFIDKFQPTWGNTQLGLQYGIALTKPQPQRKFRSGERVPLVVFFRNASDKPIKFDTAPDFFGNMPKVLNAKGEPISLENIPLLGRIPHYHEQLAPGEVLGPFYLNFGLGENPRPGQQHWHPYFKTPAAGKCKLTHNATINVSAPKDGDAPKRDDITTGTIEFEIAADAQAAAAVDDKLRSDLVPGDFTGASQVMRIGPDGKISYAAGLGICHMTLFEDDRLKIAFHNERQIWTDVTLPLVSGPGSERRAMWSAEMEGHTYQVTAIPFSTKGCVFRLEKRLNGKLIHGSQQFFATETRSPKYKPTAERDAPATAPINLREWRVDQSGTGVIAGQYTGARQVMQIAADGTVSYSDQPHGVCHIAVLDDDRLTATFLDKRGMPVEVTLPLVTTAAQQRASWSAEIEGHTLRATAIPYSDNVYVFKLEKLLNGKLVDGSQESYAIQQRLRNATPAERANAVVIPNGEILGRLIAAATNKPVAGATVSCLLVTNDNGKTRTASAVTDAEGRYSLSVPPGIHLVWVQPIDNDPSLTAAKDEVLVESGQIATSQLRLVAGRKVAGKVVDSDGKPAADLRMKYYSAAALGPQDLRTAEDGTFEFTAPPGRVQVYALDQNEKTKQTTSATNRHAEAHFNVSATDEVAPLTLTLKSEASNFDPSEWLKRSTSGTQIIGRDGNQHVTGTIVDEQGQPIPKACVFLYREPMIAANEKGEFRIETATNTTINLHAFASGYHLWLGTPSSGDSLKIVLDKKRSINR